MTKKPTITPGIVAELRQTLDRLVSETDKPSLTASSRRSLEAEIRKVIDDLGQFLNELDPIRQSTSVFDPGNPKIVGRFISLALVAQPRHALTEIARFYGSGVYAIYYKGGFPLYAALSASETPIYVGQAAPLSTTHARQWSKEIGSADALRSIARISAARQRHSTSLTLNSGPWLCKADGKQRPRII